MKRNKELMEKDNETISVLKLSYDQLSPQLKQCFVYCSLFPKDYEFHECELIAFWMAHGLLEPSNKIETPGDIGSQYLNDLFSRSLFQDYEERHTYDTFKMHDLVHDLALSVAKNECCRLNSFEQNVSPGIRHVWLTNFDSSKKNTSKFLNKLGHVRTLMYPDMGNDPTNKSFIETCLRRSQHLRMLDLSKSTLEELPEWIGNLKHLRYLNLFDCRSIKKLPNSICKLQSLQTLVFAGCDQIEVLPKNMWYMISLRFLSLTTKQRDLHGHGLEHLKSLQGLTIYVCENLEYLFEGIQKLASLHTLCVADCKNLVALPHDLKYLSALRNLMIQDCEELDLSTTLGYKEKEDDENKGFSLQSLYISNLPKLQALPQWLLQGSSNSLKNLTTKYCDNLTTSPEWHNLTSLEKVKIEHCPKLSNLPETMQLLKQLKVECCPVLSERCKQESGAEWPKIAHASLIVLDGNTVSAPNNY